MKEFANKLIEEEKVKVKGDLISRSSVIETIWNLFNRWGNDSVRFSEDETRLINTAFGMVQRDIEKLPTTHNDDWIPCSERLPEANGYYLVTQERYSLDGKHRLLRTEVCADVLFVESEQRWSRARNVKVIAWQPLPVPYQPKGE